jgi:drug/metabolite transporter (DMT)-like permease
VKGRHIPAHPYLLLVLATLFWSGNFVLGRAVTARIPPVGMAFWRWALALCVLLPFSWPHLRSQWPAIRGSWKVVLPLGVLGIGSFNTLVYIGLHETTATNAILLNSACPAFIVAISFALRSQTATPRQLAGIAVSLTGVGTIVCRGSLGNLLSLSFNRGDAWVIAAVLCWAFYTILLKKRPAGVHPLALLCALMGIGVACLAPLYAWETARGLRVSPDAATAGALLYLALLASLAAYVFWNQAVEELGANRAGAFLHLMPAFGSLLAVLLLGEAFRYFHAAGIALILAGVTLAGTSTPVPRPARPPRPAR